MVGIPAGKAPVSCCIRTLNEARRIAEVVRAAAAVCDQVVVVDSGSTDGTQDLAREAGAEVIHQPFLGQGLQKRVAEEAARHDWLLDLDADEVLSPELADEIRALFARGPQSPVYALQLVLCPPDGPPWRGFSIAWRNKLYDRRRLRMPEHRRYDQLDLPAGLRPVRLRGELMHHGFGSLSDLVAKMNRSSGRGAEHSRLKSRPALALRLLFGMPFYLLQHVVLRGRWRGGLYGIAVGAILAWGRWLRDAKMLEIHRRRAAQAQARRGE